MWPHNPGGAGADYCDPTTLFLESSSASASALSVESEDYCRVTQDVVVPRSQTQEVITPTATGDPSQPQWSAPGNTHAFTEGKPKNIDARTHVDRNQRQHKHRTLLSRGAVSHEESLAFVEDSPQLSGGRSSGGALSSAVKASARNSDTRWQRQGDTRNSALAMSEPSVYVPAELEARYATSSTAVPGASPIFRRRTKHTRRKRRKKSQEGPTMGDTQTTQDVTADGSTPNEDTVLEHFLVGQVIGSGGAGTTSVNIFKTSATPRGSRGYLPASAAAAAADATARGFSKTFATPEFAGENAGSDQAAVDKKDRAPDDPSSSDDRLFDDGQGISAAEAVMERDIGVPYAWGGRPPLRAHRYVEQSNGIFLDHAHHADMLAEYAAAADMRYAQERADARRAQRWNQLLYGSGGDQTLPRGGEGRRQQRPDGTGGSTASVKGSDTAIGRVCKRGLDDAATYRQHCVTTLHYLQRVHVFLSAFAAGVSLLTLLAMIVPFPEPHADGGPSAVLLLVVFSDVPTTQAATDPAQVFPVLEQGHPAFALLLALLQRYNASLFLCISLLLLITGYAPLAWGLAEQHWITQRQRWLKWEKKGTEPLSDGGSEAGSHRVIAEGGGYSSNSTTSSYGNGFSGTNTTRVFGRRQRLGSAAHQAVLSSSNVLAGVTRNDAHPDDNLPTTFPSLINLPHPHDRRLSMSLVGDGGQRNTTTYGRNELTCSGNIGGGTRSSILGSPLGGAHRRYSKGMPLGADPILAGTGNQSMWDVSQHIPPSAAILFSPRESSSGIGYGVTGAPSYQQQQQQHAQQGSSPSGGRNRASPSTTTPYLEPSPSPLLPPGNLLEGSLPANNYLTYAFEKSQRRAMKWVYYKLHAMKHTCCMFCVSRGDSAAKTNTAGVELRRVPWSAGTHRTEPVVHVPPYLHLLLKPRLWLVAVALVLTVSEIALVDERSIELLWLAQPASWWSAAAVPSSRRTSSGEVILPHGWTVADFSSTPVRRSGDGGEALSGDVGGSSGRLWRALTAIYATRMVVLWLAFLLNLFL